MTTLSVIEDLACAIAAGAEARFDSPITELATQHVIDILAGCFAGLHVEDTRPIIDLMSRSGTGDAGIFGREAGADVAGAAAANAVLAHAVESDPIHAETTLCIGCVTIPVVFAFAQMRQISGARAVAAVVASYDVGIGLGRLFGGAALLSKGWWPTAIFAGACAAAAAASILRLDSDRCRNALSLALMRLGGGAVGAKEAPQSRHLLLAQAVRDGVEASLAAESGAIGPAEPIAGPRGLIAALTGRNGHPTAPTGLRRGEALAETSLKRYPAALQAQSALDALAWVLNTESGIGIGTLQSIRIEVPAAIAAIVGGSEYPTNQLAGAANLRFLASLLLVDGNVRLHRMQRLIFPNGDQGRVIRDLMQRISIVVSPEMDKFYPTEMPARVTVQATGAPISKKVRLPHGHPARRIAIDETLAKLRTYSGIGTTDVLNSETPDLHSLPDLGEFLAEFVRRAQIP